MKFAILYFTTGKNEKCDPANWFSQLIKLKLSNKETLLVIQYVHPCKLLFCFLAAVAAVAAGSAAAVAVAAGSAVVAAAAAADAQSPCGQVRESWGPSVPWEILHHLQFLTHQPQDNEG